jgi:signal transduction histidine kinase
MRTCLTWLLTVVSSTERALALGTRAISSRVAVMPSIRGMRTSMSTTLASLAPLPVTLKIEGAGRLPGVVEIAAYFVVSEALANVAKYSRASAATVALGRANGHATVEVSDDGIGGADPAHGSGLRGVVDRVAALDGTLTVHSPPGRGTHLHVEIPC